MVVSSRPHLSFQEYCRIETDSPVKHEYLSGQAWAMAGGSREHAAIAANVLGMIGSQLRGSPCQAHSSDLRIRVKATGLSTYPDASIVCGRAEFDPEDALGHTVLNPTALVEVMSPSTEDYDRGDKLSHYQKIESLKEVVLVAQKEQLVEVWRRDGEAWIRNEYRQGDVPLHSVDCVLQVAELYRDPLAP